MEVQGEGGGKILMGVVMNEKVDELEDEAREGFSTTMRKELTVVVQ